MAKDLLVELLADLQASTPRMEGHIPDGLPYINIDLNQRLIKLTSDFDPLLIAGDHFATRIWFCCDRFFDTVDLEQMSIAILYKNASGNYRIAPVYVIESKEENGNYKLYFSWEINGEAAIKEGTLDFAIRFFSVDPTTHNVLFSLNTATCSARVGKGIGNPTGTDANFGYPASDIETILDKMGTLEKLLDEQSINWYDLEPEEEE